MMLSCALRVQFRSAPREHSLHSAPSVTNANYARITLVLTDKPELTKVSSLA